jgi:hypothetical protein
MNILGVTPQQQQMIGQKLSGGKFHLKRSLLKVLGSEFFIYDDNKTFLFLAFRPIKLRDEITIYADEAKTIPAIVIKARQTVITDFMGSYEVFDATNNERLAVLQRKALNSMVRDEWVIMNGNEMPVATMMEDSLTMALMRRLLSNLIPQNYDILINNQQVVDLRQNFNPFSYHLNIEMKGMFDARVAVAAAVLLASIEGRQRSF